jgi:hypothetical protein
MGTNLSTAAPTSCPTTAEVTSEISLSVQPLTAASLKDFKDLQDKATVSIQSYTPPGSEKGAPTPSPAVVVGYLVSQARIELEQYALSDLLSRLCGNAAASPYFPNTCASNYSASTQSSAQISSNFEQLRVAFRLDAESLPACLVFQRSQTHSMIGYFLKAVATQLISDTRHDHAALLHAIATNRVAKQECDTFPVSQNAGCHFYLAIVALDSALMIRSEHSADFSFSSQLSLGSAQADQIALDFSGAFLADLSIAMCPGAGPYGIPADICPDAAPDKTDGRTNATTPVAWWREQLGLRLHKLESTPVVGTTSLTAALAGFLRGADSAASIEEIVAAIAKISPQVRAPAAGFHTTSETSLAQSQQAQLQTLEFDLLGALAEFVSGGLRQFAQLSIPTVVDNVRVNNADDIQTGQIQQLVQAVSDAIYAYRDFQQGDYVDGVSQLTKSLSAVKCPGQDKIPARATNPCGFLLTDSASGLPIELLGAIAQLASTKDASSFSAAAQSISGGPDAWKRKNSETVVWLGSFVGAQGGREHLNAPGYSSSRTDYGLFVPLGFGFSWPKVIFDRPVNVYASVVDLGSLVSTSSGSSQATTAVSGGAKTGWSQLLAPGLYSSVRLLGPIYLGAGYAFKTPGLRSVTLANGQTISADSSRLEIFLGVDVSLFTVHP